MEPLVPKAQVVEVVGWRATYRSKMLTWIRSVTPLPDPVLLLSLFTNEETEARAS